jgi:hypothetical protein
MDYFGRFSTHTLYGIQKKGMKDRPHYESRPKMHELFPCTAERLHPIKSVLLLQSGTYQIKKLALVIYKEDIMWALGQKQKRTNQSDLQNRKILLPLQLCF